MKKTLAVIGSLAALLTGLAAQPQTTRPQPVAVSQPAQPPAQPSAQPPAQPAAQPMASPMVTASAQPAAPSAGSVKSAPRLESVIGQIQKATLSMNTDLARLRIERWRTDADQKDQLQKLSNSLQRNVTYAVPGLISDVQNNRGSVSAAFKLYHDVNVVYEYLNSLADAAASLGKKEEYDPLAEDAAALDSARESLSSYIEQTALILETPPKPSPTAVSSADAVAVGGGRKIIVEEVSGTSAKPTKKKTSATPAKPAVAPAKPASAKPSPSTSKSASASGASGQSASAAAAPSPAPK